MRPISSRPSRKDDGLQSFYLSRLERLIRLRRDFEDHLNDLGVDILDRSIYTTFVDCTENGAGGQARALMATLPGDGAWWQTPR